MENDRAPEEIIAVHRSDGVVDRSRPLCPYPEIAVYDGDGSSDEAENFSCQVER